MEEEEPEIFPVFEQSILPQENVGEVRGGGGREPLITEELPQKNEERAIVLFKSMNSMPFLQSPSAFSVSSDILAGLKSKLTIVPHLLYFIFDCNNLILILYFLVCNKKETLIPSCFALTIS